TAFWCAKQSLSSEFIETPDQVRRRRLIQEAGKLIQRVVDRPRAYQSRDWHRAMEMYNEADIDSLAVLEHQLRSPDLAPSCSLGTVQPEEMIHGVVADMIARRSRLLFIRYEYRSLTGPLQGPGRLLTYF